MTTHSIQVNGMDTFLLPLLAAGVLLVAIVALIFTKSRNKGKPTEIFIAYMPMTLEKSSVNLTGRHVVVTL